MQAFTGLIVGARLVIARPGGHVDAEYMAGLLEAYDVSFYNTVPLLGLEYYKTASAKRLTSLRSAIFSGEVRARRRLSGRGALTCGRSVQSAAQRAAWGRAIPSNGL